MLDDPEALGALAQFKVNELTDLGVSALVYVRVPEGQGVIRLGARPLAMPALALGALVSITLISKKLGIPLQDLLDFVKDAYARDPAELGADNFTNSFKENPHA